MFSFRKKPHHSPRPAPQPSVVLGTSLTVPRGGLITLSPAEVRTSWRLLGTSGFGKSSLELSTIVQLLRQHEAFTLIDPHTDLADAVLSTLHDTGYFTDDRAFSRLLYIEWSRQGKAVPFNVLIQPHDAHTTAQNIVEVFHRAWPSTDRGNAPLFDTILLSSLLVLIENHLPITALVRLITDKAWRDALLLHVSDPQIVSFFRDRFDVWGRGVMLESTARRLQLLTFQPVLHASLAQPDNPLDPRRLMDEGISVIHDLGGLDAETQRFIGCLLAVGYEQAALSRADSDADRRRPHHLFLEEFAMFVQTNEESLERMLALTRKYGLYSVLCNQTNSQIGRALQGAMGNIGVEVAFRLSPEDAREAAPRFTRYDPQRLTYHSPTASASYASRAEQVQETVTALETLPKRQALVRFPDRLERIETLTVPTHSDRSALARIKHQYAERLLRPVQQFSAETAPQPHVAPRNDDSFDTTAQEAIRHHDQVRFFEND